MKKVDLPGADKKRVCEALRKLVLEAGGDRCLSCGACVAGCPVADWSEERLDPRRLVRLIQNGRGDLIVEMDWIWQCTECGRCNYTCPAGVDLASMICRARGLVPKDRSPGQIQKTADLHRTVSNNMGLEVKDWLETVDWMAEELREEIEGLEVPIEKHGAEYFATINSKLPM
jgi:heterodisulfide reductase subunit C